MGQKGQHLQTGPLTMQHGHNGTHILIKFSHGCENLILTPEQADALCASVQQSKALLATHLAAQQSAKAG